MSSRRRWFAIAAAVALLAGALWAWHRHRTDHTFPRVNLVILSIDTLRADHLSGYGYPLPTSPQFDALLAESVRFTDCWSPAPTTAPAHMTMFTGLMPAVHGIFNAGDERPGPAPLPLSAPTLAELLRRRGYRTMALTGDVQLRPWAGFSRGFESWQGDFFSNHNEPAAPATIAERQFVRLRSFLAAAGRQGEPAFAFIHHYLCHGPYQQAPAAEARRFAPNPLPAPLRRWFRDDRFVPIESDLWATVDPADPASRQGLLALYDGEVAYSDALLGRLVELLRDGELLDRTVLVVTSDHGEEFFEHGGHGHGALFVEHLRVPLAIRFPGAAWGGRTVTDPVGLADLLPTLCDYLELPPPDPVQGRSLRPLVAGERPAPRLQFSYQLVGDTVPALLGIRATASDHALVHPLTGDGDRLYDRAADPGETGPVAPPGAAARRAELQAAVETQLAEDRTLRERLLGGEPGGD